MINTQLSMLQLLLTVSGMCPSLQPIASLVNNGCIQWQTWCLCNKVMVNCSVDLFSFVVYVTHLNHSAFVMDRTFGVVYICIAQLSMLKKKDDLEWWKEVFSAWNCNNVTGSASRVRMLTTVTHAVKTPSHVSGG